MTIKKMLRFVMIVVMVPFLLRAGDTGGGLDRIFADRNRAALAYKIKKHSVSGNLISAAALASGWGAFNFLRSKQGASDLTCFTEGVAIAGTTYKVLDLSAKFLLNYIVRWHPSVARAYRAKRRLTKALEQRVDTHQIRTVFELPNMEHEGSQTAIKMYNRLCEKIAYGGLDSSNDWAEKFRETERPDFFGHRPTRVDDVIDEIKHPAEYIKRGKLASRSRGIILSGPSGTGKTTLGKLISFEAGCVLKLGSVATLANRYIGTATNGLKDLANFAHRLSLAAHEKNKQIDAQILLQQEWNKRSILGYLVWRLGQLAKNTCNRILGRKGKEYIRPCILQLDEGDTAGRSRDEEGSSEDKKTVDTLLNLVDDKSLNVFFVLTTNQGRRYFDNPVLRRFGDDVIVVGLPEKKDRFDIIKGYLRDKDFIKYLDPSLIISKKILDRDYEYHSELLPYCFLNEENRIAAMQKLRTDEEAKAREKACDDQLKLYNLMEQIDESIRLFHLEYDKHADQLAYWQNFVEKTDQFSGADLRTVLSLATKKSVREGIRTGNPDQKILRAYIDEALEYMVQLGKEKRAKISKGMAKKHAEKNRKHRRAGRLPAGSEFLSKPLSSEDEIKPSCASAIPQPQVEIVEDRATESLGRRFDQLNAQKFASPIAQNTMLVSEVRHAVFRRQSVLKDCHGGTLTVVRYTKETLSQ